MFHDSNYLLIRSNAGLTRARTHNIYEQTEIWPSVFQNCLHLAIHDPPLGRSLKSQLRIFSDSPTLRPSEIKGVVGHQWNFARLRRVHHPRRWRSFYELDQKRLNLNLLLIRLIEISLPPPIFEQIQCLGWSLRMAYKLETPHFNQCSKRADSLRLELYDRQKRVWT